jgi:hypothetical protein
MHRTRSWFLLAAVLLVGATAHQTDARIRKHEPTGEVPPVLFTTLPRVDSGYPTFVSASAAISARGEIAANLFHPHAVRSLKAQLAEKPIDGCVQFGPVYWELINFPDRSTLSRTVETSNLTIVGRVVDREYGFMFFEAGQLIEVEVDERIRGEAPLDRYYYFHPVGEFEAGPYRICKSDDRYPAPPELGDRVVLMVPQPVHDPRERFLDIQTAEGIVVLEAGGEVRLPATLSADGGTAPSTPAAVLDIVRRESLRPDVPR